MKYKLAPDGTKCTITISGEMAILNANELKQVLVESLGKYSFVRLDLGQVETIDLPSIQLLCSANISYEKSGKTGLEMDHNTASIEDALTEIGYTNDMGCMESPCDTCLWKGDK